MRASTCDPHVSIVKVPQVVVPLEVKGTYYNNNMGLGPILAGNSLNPSAMTSKEAVMQVKAALQVLYYKLWVHWVRVYFYKKNVD